MPEGADGKEHQSFRVHVRALCPLQGPTTSYLPPRCFPGRCQRPYFTCPRYVRFKASAWAAKENIRPKTCSGVRDVAVSPLNCFAMSLASATTLSIVKFALRTSVALA